MPLLNPFESDAFSLTSLTASMNNTPFTPTQLSKMGLYEEDGITTLSAVIEVQNNTLDVVEVQPRNSPGKPVTGDKREVFTFKVPHLPEVANIMADEVQGVRAFGTENQTQTVQSVINKRLQKMRRQIDYTMEMHRMANLNGQYVDSNGNLLSMSASFGVAEAETIHMNLAAAETKLRALCVDIKEKSREKLQSIASSGYTVLCGINFWKDLIEAKAFKETYLNSQSAAALRGDPTERFVWGGFTWEPYEGNALVKIPDDEARVIPRGIPGLFITRFAPANYAETVNTRGLPYYARPETLKHNEGVEVEAQSNPINLCTRPEGILKLHRAAAT